jgi:phosphate transport system protein
MKVSHFHRQIEELQDTVLKMAGLVEEAMDRGTRSVIQRDSELAQEVIRGDRRIDLLENEVFERGVALLATQQPVAVDLRLIAGLQEISSCLERMGDQAVNLAQRAQVLAELDPVEAPAKLGEMATIAHEMTQSCLQALVRRDIRLANAVCCRDDELDDLNRLLLEEMIQWMMGEKRLIRRGVELILAGRHLERIGDEATNIAEAVVFLTEGRVISHLPRTEDMDDFTC